MRKLLTTLGLVAALAGCGYQPCERLEMKTGQTTEITRVGDYFNLKPYVTKGPSKVTFNCALETNYDASIQETPGGISTEICVAGRCEKNPGGFAHMNFWKGDWDHIQDINSFSCVVRSNAYDILEGPSWNTRVVDHVSEEELLRTKTQVTPECSLANDNGPTYCHDFDDNGNCTNWSR